MTTEHYTKEEAVELAREFDEDAFKWDGIGSNTLLSTINTAVTRKLAEKELEVLKLREALNYIGAITPDGGGVNMVVDKALSLHTSTEHLDEYVAGKVKEAHQFYVTEIEKLRNIKFARFNNEDCWVYQGDGTDNLDSLVCPVVIAPYTLLDLTAKLAAAEDRVKELEKDVGHYAEQAEYWEEKYRSIT